jgi:hypothetical protein
MAVEKVEFEKVGGETLRNTLASSPDVGSQIAAHRRCGTLSYRLPKLAALDTALVISGRSD